MAADPSSAPGEAGAGSARADSRRGFTRRHLLTGGAAAAAGAVVALGAERALAHAPQGAGGIGAGLLEAGGAEVGSAVEPFHGAHQAGIATEPQAHATLIAFDLRPGTDREGVRRMLTLLSDDAARMATGMAPLADPEPELAAVPARLTVTFGFGPGLVARVAPHAAPAWLAPLPAFGIDRLEPAWSDGDLLLQVCADDPVTVAHAVRMLRKDARAFATERWVQQGFRRARGSEASGTTMRNLFGQVDGTANPVAGSADFDTVVWADAPGWLAGGTSLVLRRIAMDLDGWDGLDRPGREASVGRTLDTGAPLTGGGEHDPVDLAAIGANGLPVIAAFAHVRRSRSSDPVERIYRRGYNYELADGGAGLLFASFQADPVRQFVPLQRRLDELDLLNTWTTPIGSAVFAVPPGCREGGFVGETLFAA